MANNQDSSNQSFAAIQASEPAVAGIRRRARARIWLGRTTAGTASDNASSEDASFHAIGTDLNVAYLFATVTEGGALGLSGSIGFGVYVFYDDQDGGGNGTSKVRWVTALAQQELGFTPGVTFDDAATIPQTFVIPGAVFDRPGSYAVVPVLYNIEGVDESSTGGPRQNQVTSSNPPDDPGPHHEFYLDGCKYRASSAGAVDDPALTEFSANSGAAGPADFARVGVVRVGLNPQSLTASVTPNQGYSAQPTISFDLTTAASLALTGATPQVRSGPITPASAVTVAPAKTLTKTLAAGDTGTLTTTAYNVDTDFPSAATTHRLRLYVGARGGQATVPTAEKAALYRNHPATTVNNEGSTWTYFASVGAGLTKLDNFTVEANTNLSIGHGILEYTTSALATRGVLAFDGATYATQRSIFRRAGPTVTQQAIPALETFIADVFGVALASKSFKVDVLRHSDSTAEPAQQTVTSASSPAGRLRWNYTIAATHTAFNRFKKATTDNPGAAPATFTGSPVAGPHPAYPKHVKITGNAYAGTKEPTVTRNNVFGVNSEIHFEDIWTGDAAQATIDANGEPTGFADRTKNLGTGSMRLKLSTEINETNGAILTPGEHNPKTVDGNDIIASTDTLAQRYAVFKRTGSSVEQSSVNSTKALAGSKGYDTSPDDGFELYDATGDPRTLDFLILAADIAAVATSLNMTGDIVSGGAPWVPSTAPTGGAGAQTDQGNFGYFVIRVQFIAVDPDLVLVLVTDQSVAPAGEDVRFSAKTGKFLPDNSFTEINPDSAPTLYIYRVQGAGMELSTILNAAVMTPVGAEPTPDWEYLFTPPQNGTYKALCTALANGSRPPAPGEVTFGSGTLRDPDLQVAFSVHNLTGGSDRHVQVGDTLKAVVTLTDMATGLRVTPDSAEIWMTHIDAGTLEMLDDDTDNTAAAFASWPAATPVTVFAMTANGSDATLMEKTFSATAGWTSSDVVIRVEVVYRGVRYPAFLAREIAGRANGHGKYELA